MHTIPDIAPFRDKLSDLNEQMADPDFYSDQRRAADVSREQMRLSTLVEKFEAYHSTVEQLKENQAMAADDSVEALCEITTLKRKKCSQRSQISTIVDIRTVDCVESAPLHKKKAW